MSKVKVTGNKNI